MAIIGALALLTGTIVTMLTAFAYADPNQKVIGDPNERSGSSHVQVYGDPNERVLVH
jgi:hypothetical protein